MSRSTLLRHLVDVLGPYDNSRGLTYDFHCPFCLKLRTGQKQGHFHADIGKNMGLCHKCGSGSRNFHTLVVYIGGSDYAEKIERIERKVSLKHRIWKEFFSKSKINKKEDIGSELCEMDLPPEFLTILGSSNSRYARTCRDYLKSRGIGRDLVSRDKIGYCWEGRYEGNIIFPVRMYGKIVYFTTRRLFGAGGKTLNPRVPKSPILFNYDNVRDKKTIWLGEGPFDAYSFPNKSGTALLGSFISNGQLELLRDTKAREIVVCMDSDAVTKAYDIASKIKKAVGEKKEVSLVRLAEGDPNDCIDELPKLYQNREMITSSLRARLLQIQEK